MTLKALVCDDEAPARSELRFLLSEAGGVEVVGEASSAGEALQLIRGVPYDVVFIDIDMPGVTGLAMAEALAEFDRPPAVVFVTAHGEHAVRAFEVAAVDYLVKPVELSRLVRAIERVSSVAPQRATARVERVPVEKAGRKVLLDVGDIVYVMAKDDYAYLYTEKERFLSTMSLAHLEQRLEPSGFFRVHRRFLVSLDRVAEVTPMYGGALTLSLRGAEDTQVPVSRRRVPALKRALGL